MTADPFASDAEPGLSRRALVAAEATGDPAALAMALHARYSELLDPEHVLERLTLGGRAVRLGRDTGDTESACWGHLWRLDAFVELGRRAPLSAELAAFAAATEHLREPLWLWRLGLIRACAAMFEGRFAQARVLATEALAAGRRGGHDAAGFHDLILASHLALSTGDGLDAVEAGVRAFAGRGPFFARGWHALVLLGCGRRDEAAAIWAELAPHVDEFPRRALEWIVAASSAHRDLRTLGDPATARTVYGQLEPYADRYAAGSSYTPDGGPVSMYLGMLAILLEDWPAAERHLDAALASSRAMGSAPYEATTRLHLARLRLARQGPGDAPAAVRDLEAAGRIAGRLGMAPLAAQVAALSRTSGAVLSAREEEVAALVAEGLSNRQIASRLGLSERTAENHVPHILTKLGFTSRARIAAWQTARTGDRVPR